MVYSSEEETIEIKGSGSGRRRSYMVMERSTPLHNFALPRLKWGYQKHLRCVKVGSDDSRASSDDRRSLYGFSPFRSKSERFERRRSTAVFVSKLKTNRGGIIDCDKEIGAVREKFMIDLRAAMDKMRDELLGEGLESGRSKEEDGESGAAADSARPWNLRTRRAACKAPDGGGKVSCSPLKTDAAGESKPLLRSNGGERPKFAATLTRKEIEDDFFKMTGQRPPRRPKRRPKAVQKQVETLFPAFWSTEMITPDMYKVQEISDNTKR